MRDVWGLCHAGATSGTGEAWRTALLRLNEYRRDVPDLLTALIEAEPGFASARVARAGFLLMGGCRAVMPKVEADLAVLREALPGLPGREALHVRALERFAANDLGAACGLWEAIVAGWPTDLLALRFLHHQRFWQGQPALMRETAAGALRAWDRDLPGYGFVLGMLAFGCEECGEYGRAERLGREACERNPDDMWSIHAVAHVLEMQCRESEGQAWLGQAPDAWADRTSFKGHLWWHKALFALEEGHHDEALTLYDALIRPASPAAATDVQNAASLLARLDFLGVDVGPRWRTLSEDAARWTRNELVPFTDLHALIPLAREGRTAEADDLVASLEERAASGTAFPGRVVDERALPVALGIVLFYAQDYEGALERLMPLRDTLQPLGGSHAQRDLFHQLLLEAAIRAGRWSAARELALERTGLKPNSRAARRKLVQVERSAVLAQAAE